MGPPRGAPKAVAATVITDAPDITVTRIRPVSQRRPIPSRSAGFAFALLLIARTAQADPAPVFADCPFSVSIPYFSAGQPPEWKNWDSATFPTSHDGIPTDVSPHGLVCIQTYRESTIGIIDTPFENMLEFTKITSDFKEAWQRQGAEIVHESGNDVVAHLSKDGKEYWLEVSLPRRGNYRVTVLEVQPFKRTLFSPRSR